MSDGAKFIVFIAVIMAGLGAFSACQSRTDGPDDLGCVDYSLTGECIPG